MVFSVDGLSIELEEEERLRNKIRADHEKALEEAKEKLQKSRDEIQAEIQTEKNKIIQSLKNKGSKPLPPVPVPNLVGIKSGDPTDPDVREKRDKIKEQEQTMRNMPAWLVKKCGVLNSSHCKGIVKMMREVDSEFPLAFSCCKRGGLQAFKAVLQLAGICTGPGSRSVLASTEWSVFT
ncbi:UNVERIFIED_CONTAM: hypothetical protein K2H54_019436 [Gekko kuhli]